MKNVLPILAVLLLFAGCSSDVTEPAVEQTTDMWYVDGVRFDSEPEAWDAMTLNKDGSQSECWHWTHDDGRWYVRHCGLTLAEECYTPGPRGSMLSCDLVGGGPGGNW
ncbi:MAG: hypothetical protein AMS18_07110 [Gemmatimonas sp. SG8_17]|nr:MAG: hypothetical protein AMS18_07110 [Gemmatimonas sp. SG8_17]